MVLRPHHVLCVRHYRGRGYDAAFVRNMDAVCARLARAPGEAVVLRSAPDVLCAACPHLHSGVCASDEKVRGFDARALRALGLCEGSAAAWETLCAAAIDPARVCGGCEWGCGR